MSTHRQKLLPLESRFTLEYPTIPNLIFNLTTFRPPPRFVWMHGAGNVMADAMNRDFNIGFCKVSTVLGLNKGGSTAESILMFETLVKNEAAINSLGGRSVGSVTALNALLNLRGQRLNNFVLISFPFGTNYNTAACNLLTHIPLHINIFFLTPDSDDHARINAEGKSLDNSYQFINRALPNHKVWKVMMRHSSHGNNVPEEHGGNTAKTAMLQTAGQVVAGWLCGDTKTPEGFNEGCIWYDINAKRAYWSGWQPIFNLATAAEWKI